MNKTKTILLGFLFTCVLTATTQASIRSEFKKGWGKAKNLFWDRPEEEKLNGALTEELLQGAQLALEKLKEYKEDNIKLEEKSERDDKTIGDFKKAFKEINAELGLLHNQLNKLINALAINENSPDQSRIKFIFQILQKIQEVLERPEKSIPATEDANHDIEMFIEILHGYLKSSCDLPEPGKLDRLTQIITSLHIQSLKNKLEETS